MKVISFNVNSLRARLHQLSALIESHAPDIIGLQETKVSDTEFPLDAIHALGYQAEFHGQKGHYGVALLHKGGLISSQRGFEHDDNEAQRRFIQGEFDVPGYGRVTVVNCYFPQGECRDHESKFPNKQKFYQDLHTLLEQKFASEQPLLVMGDMNVAPEDSDIGIGDNSRQRWLRSGKCSFLPEEREWLKKLHDLGLSDTYRKHFPDTADKFSWFDYRSRGFDREPKRGLRIDHILTSNTLLQRCTAAGIDYDIRRMEKPSDHCPVWATFE